MKTMTQAEAMAYVKNHPETKFHVRPVSLFGYGVFEPENETRYRCLIYGLTESEARRIASARP